MYGTHLFNIFQKYKINYFPDMRRGWISAFTYDRPENTISLKRNGDGRKIDLFRLRSLEKTYFANEKGFTATVKRMSSEELYRYIQHALI